MPPLHTEMAPRAGVPSPRSGQGHEGSLHGRKSESFKEPLEEARLKRSRIRKTSRT